MPEDTQATTQEEQSAEETYEFASPDFDRSAEEDKAVDENPAENIADVDEDESIEEPGEEASGEEEEASPSEIGPDLIYQAAQIGMSLDDVKRFSTADDLLIAMNMIKSRGESQEQEQDQEQKQEWYDLDFGEDEIDEELAKPLVGMNEYYKEKYTALENTLAEMKNQMLQREHMEYEQRFEDNINSLGEEWKDTLGKGGIDDVKETQLENRKRLFQAVDRIAEMDASKNVVRPMKKIIKDALLYEFKDKIKGGERRKLLAQANKRTKTRKPARKQKSFANDEDDAISFIRDGLSEMGAKVDDKAFVPFG